MASSQWFCHKLSLRLLLGITLGSTKNFRDFDFLSPCLHNKGDTLYFVGWPLLRWLPWWLRW